MDFVIRVANTIISIHSIYSGIYSAWKDYMIDASTKPDIIINTDDDMISGEILLSQKSGRRILNRQIAEQVLIQRIITEKMLDRDVLLMHGAVVAYNKTSYMFSGKSGTGKTTHVQKWLENEKDAYIVNGDKPFIIITSDGAFACGTPWCGKENYNTNAIVPMRSIVLMQRDNNNSMEQVHFNSVFPTLLEQTYHPLDVGKVKKTLELLTKLKKNVSFFHFRFNNFKDDAFRVSFSTLSKQD